MSEAIIRRAGGLWVVINDEGERDFYRTLEEAQAAAGPRALDTDYDD